MRTKEDYRVVKTKIAIQTSFIELVECKGYNKVSVKDITEMAHINRNTFYLHYLDKEDLVYNMINDTFSPLKKMLLKSKSLTNIYIDNIKEESLKYGYRVFLDSIEPNIEFYRILLLDDSLIGYLNVLRKELKTLLWDYFKMSNPRFDLMFEYIYNGVFGVIEQWIIYAPLSNNETARVLAKLSYKNIQDYQILKTMN